MIIAASVMNTGRVHAQATGLTTCIVDGNSASPSASLPLPLFSSKVPLTPTVLLPKTVRTTENQGFCAPTISSGLLFTTKIDADVAGPSAVAAASQVLGAETVVPTPTTTPKATPTTTPTVIPVGTPKPRIAPVVAPAEIESLFQQHAITHNVDAEIMKKIAQCESGMRPEATNGPYGGMFQFVSSTWISNRRAMGKDTDPNLRFNAAEAIETAAFKMGRDGYGAWPACSRKALASI